MAYLKKFKMSVLLLLLLAFAGTSCTTSMKHAENAEGTGRKVVFNNDFDTVWSTTLNVIGTTSLDIEKQDKNEGKILAKGSISFFSWGENVAIFVKKVSSNSTSLEVVSKRVVKMNVFATEWAPMILEKVTVKLDGVKAK